MAPTFCRSIASFRSLLILAMLIAASSAAGCAQGQYITHTTIEWPGATQRQMDEVVAKPVGRRLFGATNGVVDVTSISSSGKVDLYATSDGLTKLPEFLDAVNGSLSDSSAMVPRGVVVGPVEVLPKGQPVPQVPMRSVDTLSIDINRSKLIDSGVSYEDVSRAVAKAREAEVFRIPAETSITAPAVQQMIQALRATTLPSRDKPVALGDVTYIHVVPEPATIERHWP